MTDFIQRAISRSEEICNQMVCPSCGQHHQVSFYVTKKEGILAAHFSEAACDDFRKKCQQIFKDNFNRSKKEDFDFLNRL